MSAPFAADERAGRGGLARYFVEHREVGWAALVAVLIWGWISYGKLPQQEDPKIPERRALLVTHFPGADTLKVEQLVTKKLEKKIAELESIEEVTSQSRNGASIITLTQLESTQARVEQEWDKLRSKLAEASLPEGCQAPFLNTDFGNTITLLFAVTSPAIKEAECVARARLLRRRLAEIRQGRAASGRAAVAAFFPPAVARDYRAVLTQRFTNLLAAAGAGSDLRLVEGESFAVADFEARTNRAGLKAFLDKFGREISGTETDLQADYGGPSEVHPDLGGPFILMGDEDPLPQIRAAGLARYSYRELEKAVELFEDEMRQVPTAGKVAKIGVVNEAVYLLFSTARVNGFKLTPDEVIAAIAARNAIIPGGSLRTERQNFPVQLTGEFANEQELQRAVIGVVKGGGNAGGLAPGDTALPVYLRDLFDVRRGYENPIPYKADVLTRSGPNRAFEGHRAVLLAVEMKTGSIISQFDAVVERSVQRLQPRLPEGMAIVRVSNQPAAVAQRIQGFSRCFAEAVLIVILVSLFIMDWRSAVVVATAIPLTVAMTLGGMWLLAVPLHQISIAALIIALGMLVDDPVVACDGINREIAAGHPRQTAAWLGPFRLRRPILYATVINIVAFLPLIWLPNDKGSFIMALPIVVTLALVSSRLVSMTFIPLLGYYVLRGQKGLEAGATVRAFVLFAWVDRAMLALLPRYKRLLGGALERPWRTIGAAYGLLAASFLLVPFFGQQFFPPAERNQLLIDVELPESASITQTRQVCRQIAGLLKRQPEIESVAIFTGGTAPRFYYNVNPREPGSFLGQIVINTRTDKEVPVLLARLRASLDQEIAGARCLVKQLEQGPPVESPIQIRISGDNLDQLRGMADEVSVRLRQAGAYKVHDDLGRRMPTLEIAIDQERASTLGINNAQVGRLAQAAFTGLKVTELREGDHLIPVVIRLRVEDRNEADKIRSLYVDSREGDLVPLDSFARLKVNSEFATIAHFNQLRAVTVQAYSAVGELPATVLGRARAALSRLPLPPGCKLEFAGEEKELRESQSEMGMVMAVSLSLILFAMVMQFHSIIKALVVMLIVPLGLIGAFVGVGVMHTALGFMALLGIVSLAGVIVSHIIVLSDFIEEARAEGMELKTALMQAGLVRLRAVLATVLATVCGLVPLAVSGGELWRPLTAVHIFGLLGATVLTLVLLPVLYYVFCQKLRLIH